MYRCGHTGGVKTETTVAPVCRLECKHLSMQDYVELLMTTVSEVPGNCLGFLTVDFLTYDRL